MCMYCFRLSDVQSFKLLNVHVFNCSNVQYFRISVALIFLLMACILYFNLKQNKCSEHQNVLVFVSKFEKKTKLKRRNHLFEIVKT